VEGQRVENIRGNGEVLALFGFACLLVVPDPNKSRVVGAPNKANTGIN